MVERFQQEGRFATVPLSKDPTEDMCPKDYDEQQEMRNIPYRSIIGSLLYARLTRPDIVQAVAKLASFQGKPGRAHWKMALQVLHYLNKTKRLDSNIEARIKGAGPYHHTLMQIGQQTETTDAHEQASWYSLMAI